MIDLLTGFKNKRGSFTVFTVMIFISITVLLAAAADSAGNIAIESVTQSFGRLWGKSILAEYDVMPKERYGILAFKGNNVSVAEKIDKYKDYSFREKAYIESPPSYVELEKYLMTEPKNLKKQIEKVVASGIKPDGDSENGNTEETSGSTSDRYISSNWIKKGLPSYGRAETGYIEALVNKIKAGFGIDDIMGNAAVDRYISVFFNNYLDDKNLKETYFRCETEYIISGKPDDEKSRENTASKIKRLRNMLNLYYLYTCDEKRETAMAIATAITPGTAAVLTQAAILEIWAYAEAENDMEILYDKKTVPLLKNDSNWALSAENVFGSKRNGTEGKNGFDDGQKSKYVSPEIIAGENYDSYLKILLCGISENTKLLRMMDLIQINMKFVYNETFLMKEYSMGLEYMIKVNGRKYEFDEHY